MQAFVINEPHAAEIAHLPYPEPGPEEVTITVKNVGICGTDLHIYNGVYLAQYPVTPGHEFSGIIDAIGENVSGWNVGERVVVDPCLFCGQCRFCRAGKTNQCQSFGGIGVTTAGALAEYVCVPAIKVYKLPDALSFAQGAFVEPLACVAYGMQRLQLQFGDRVLLFGAGSIGQQLVQALDHSGASVLVVVDISPAKLELAIKYGATKSVLSPNIEQELSRFQYPDGFDVVVDATGIPAVIQQALGYLGPTAKYLQFGVAPKNSEITIDPFELYHKDWTLMGSMAVNLSFQQALNWLAAGRIDVKPLISKTLHLSEVTEFFAQPKECDNLKVQVSL